MSLRRVSQGIRCLSCKMSPQWCYCNQLKPVKISTKITFVIHKKELFLPSNTANLLKLISPENCEFILRGDDQIQSLKLESGHSPYYLFPDEEATQIDENWSKSLQEPIQIIVPDGTWRQANKIKRRTPGLEKVPSIKLPHMPPSQYFLRKQKFDHGQSTFEATAFCIGLLEGSRIYQELMENFAIMMAQFAAANPYRAPKK